MAAWPSNSFFEDKGYLCKDKGYLCNEENIFTKTLPNGVKIVLPSPCAANFRVEIVEGDSTTIFRTYIPEDSCIHHFIEIFLGYILTMAENTAKRC